MKDKLAHLEKLREQVCECELIRDLAMDKAKRELFDRLAKHLGVLADEIEKAIVSETKGRTKPPPLQMAAESLAREITREA
jgi:FMN phosphatase YigB (HAD superfamily)